MFKKHLHLLIVFGWLAVTVLPFQNCGAGLGMRAAEETTQLSVKDFDQDVDEDHNVTDKRVEKGTTYEPVLADRYYIDQLLLDVFGPTARTADGGGAAANAVIHGGPCSLYENHSIYSSSSAKYVIASTMENCGGSSGSLLVAEINPKASVTRQALLARTCTDLTANTTTFNFAMKRISEVATSDSVEDQVRGLYRLFYRTQPDPHQGLVDSLVIMLPATSPSLDDWRAVIYTVCMSSYWQVL